MVFSEYGNHQAEQGVLDIATGSQSSSTATLLLKRRAIASSRLQKVLRRKASRRRLTHVALVGANVLLLGVVVWFVGSESPAAVSSADTKTAAATVVSSAPLAADVSATSPVDTYTASDVAVSVALATRLDETPAVTNQAQSARVAVVASASDVSIVAKPQIVDTPLKTWRDIREYTVVAGDTVTSVAQKFGVTSDSVRWSNGLTGDVLTIGKILYIPPSNGVVYTVVAGDTPQSLATKYHADVNTIMSDNEAEIGSLVVGRRVFIANGQIMTASAARRATARSFSPVYGYNGYDPGWCTYYAAAKSGAPANWGNANTWAYYAARSGWKVSSTPTAGAIFQTPRGSLGHVGIVDAVSEDGTMIKYSDMNGLAGWGRVGYSDWIPATKFPNYISR